jgi:hypothetical protein
VPLTLNNRGEVPPGGFRYFQRETKQWFNAPSWIELLKAVKAHRVVNALPVGTQFSEEIEDQLCQNCPPETCQQGGGSKKLPQRGAVSFQGAMDTAALLADWFLKRGQERVSAEQAEQRAGVCIQCPFNQPIEGCRSCSFKHIRALIVKIVGGQPTKYSNRLNACSVCGCSLQAKVHLPISLLNDYMSAEQKQDFPEFCWVKKELQGTSEVCTAHTRVEVGSTPAPATNLQA